jgi:CRP-like cAMP-binding protein
MENGAGCMHIKTGMTKAAMTQLLLDRPRTSDALSPYMPGNNLDLHHGRHQAGLGASSRRSATSSPHSPAQNHLLAALPEAELERLSPHLELVPLPLGEMLYEPARRLEYAYFPTSAIVSLHYVMESGMSAEAAGVGNEGVVGISLFMGGATTSSSAVVQTAGHGYRLPRRLLKQEFDRAGPIQHVLLRYTQALITQMMQTAACNRHHLVEQQLCRWLLLILDRADSREVVMTQELAASMLGVRREVVTSTAGKLQRAGVIRYHRGHITVLERSGLETRACECYAVVKTELSQLLSDVRHRQGIPVWRAGRAAGLVQ